MSLHNTTLHPTIPVQGGATEQVHPGPSPNPGHIRDHPTKRHIRPTRLR